MDEDTWIDIMNYGAHAGELDWIAIDNLGHVGVFSAIMDAPISIEVKKSYELYCELETIINKLPEYTSAEQVTTYSGDFSDWLKYSKKGLFAFDFQDAHRTKKEELNQYDLISRPSNPINIKELKLSKDIKTIIPRIESESLFGESLQWESFSGNLIEYDKLILLKFLKNDKK